MGQYCIARSRLSSVVVCNAADGRAGRPLGAWEVGRRWTGRVGGRVADTVRRASTVTSRATPCFKCKSRRNKTEIKQF